MNDAASYPVDDALTNSSFAPSSMRRGSGQPVAALEQQPELLRRHRLAEVVPLRFVIRAGEHTRHLPVVVLTSSDEEKDRLVACSRFANSYVRKPVDADQFAAAARDLGLYWLVLNRPPPRRP
jgi:DNA-binding response OmpR family regulator